MSEVKFLPTKEISASIDKIIKEAKKHLYIISPYLRPDGNVKKLLSDESALKDIDVNVVYRKDKERSGERHTRPEVAPETVEWFASRPWIKTHHMPYLHAKCYLNEKQALVASLNLTGGAMINNVEMGILVSKGTFWWSIEEIEKLYEDILDHAKWIVRLSEEVSAPSVASAAAQSRSPSSDQKSDKKQASRTSREAAAVLENGFCIRCGAEINADPTKPFCKRHWRYWNKDKYDEYQQEYCHTCGKEHSATRLKPACYPCYKKYKDVFEFPAA